MLNYLLETRKTPPKIKSPPAMVKNVICSWMNAAAKITVIKGSANRNELATAALVWLMTLNQMK
jgi:hypothetical protein